MRSEHTALRTELRADMQEMKTELQTEMLAGFQRMTDYVIQHRHIQDQDGAVIFLVPTDTQATEEPAND